MTKKRKTVLTAAAAFAASPQGRRLLERVKEYATRPETKARAQELLAQARARRQGRPQAAPPAPSRSRFSVPRRNTPSYGTPPQH
jgi:hypothetical protein